VPIKADPLARVAAETRRSQLRAFAALYVLSIAAISGLAYGLRMLLRWGLQ